MRQSLRIVWNVATSYAKEAVLVVLALILNPYLFHKLGDKAYGVIALTGVTAGFLYLLDVGMGHAVARYVSKNVALEDKAKVSEVVSSALAIYTVIGLVAFAIIACIGLFFLPRLGVPTEVLAPARWVILFMAVALLIRFMCYAFEGTLRGLQRFDVSNAAYLVERLVYAGGAFVAVGLLGQGLVAVGFSLFLGFLVANVVRFVAVFKVYQGLRVGWGLASWNTAIEMLKFGGLAAFTQLASFFEKTGVPLVLSASLGSTVLGYYNLVMVAAMMQVRLATAVNVVIMPVASKFETLAEEERLRRLLIDGGRAVLTIVVPAAVWMMVMARSLLVTWVGEDLAPFARLLVIMAAVELLDLICAVGNQVLVGMGAVRRLGVIYLLTSAFNLGCLAVLLRVTDWGIYCVPAALGTGILIRRTTILHHMCVKVGITSWRYIREVLLPVFGAGLLTAATLIFAQKLLPDAGWGMILLSIAIGGTVHLAASWLIVVSSAERRRLIGWFGGAFQRARHRLSNVGRDPQ